MNQKPNPEPNPRRNVRPEVRSGQPLPKAADPNDQTIDLASLQAEAAAASEPNRVDSPPSPHPPTSDVADDPNRTWPSTESDRFDPHRTDVHESSPSNRAASTGATTFLPSPSMPSPSMPVQTDHERSGKPSEIEQTTAFSQVDQTVDLTETSPIAGSTGHRTVPISAVDRTVEFATNMVPDKTVRTVHAKTRTDLQGNKTILNDTNISQTINPRELSVEEAAFWGDLSQRASAVPSELAPAIQRSLSETKLHLRNQIIVDSRSELANRSDYRLKRLLGKGGMGNVYFARQGSLDRNVALKVIKPLEEEKKRRFLLKGNLEQVEQERRLQFISEAVITGDLDHPNIVPIHDIAVTGDNTLFYSMKCVTGKPWSKVIHENSQVENIDILLKVCDAIGFAHTRGVVHRDIKPENIMIGEFGVVMVMDWGLALAKPEFEKRDNLHHSPGLGGSPAYMAPEMAIGPVDRIGPASDIYLLGATLFQIVTGHAPHQASNVSECLKVVAANKIREVPPEQQSELLQIALKAMATKPEDRYENVQAFQAAIREYRSHSESIRLTSDAFHDLERAKQSGVYEQFSRAIFGFEEAIRLWSGNHRATEGLQTARMAYGESAYQKGDFDLGLSLLAADVPSHQDLIDKLKAAKRERMARDKRLSLLRKVAVAMLAFIMIGGSLATYMIHRRAEEARIARGLAEQNAMAARAAKEVAERSEQEARDALKARGAALDREREARVQEQAALSKEQLAKQEVLKEKEKVELAKMKVESALTEVTAARDAESAAKKVAESATVLAQSERAKAEYEYYVAQIGLAKARIDQNEFVDAQRILRDLKQSLPQDCGWEWRWLWKQTTQATATLVVQTPLRGLAPIESPSMNEPKRWGVVTMDGRLAMTSVKTRNQLQLNQRPLKVGFGDATAMTSVSGGHGFFVATQSGDIEHWDDKLQRRLRHWNAHKTTINRMLSIDQDLLLTASDDRSVRLWDIDTLQSLAICWNLGSVKDLAIAQTEKGLVVAQAVSESESGRVTVWLLRKRESNWEFEQIGEYLEHAGPVNCVDIDPAGEQVASGDRLGRIHLWSVQDAPSVDYPQTLADAVKSLAKASPATNERKPVRFKPLIHPEYKASRSTRDLAHRGPLRVLRFSADGSRLLSGADDYLVQIWDLPATELRETFRGHGGAITDAAFLSQDASAVLSVSLDGTARTWLTQVNATEQDVAPNDLLLGKIGHRDEILTVRLNREGNQVVSGGQDRTAILARINADTGALEPQGTLRDQSESSESAYRPLTLEEGSQFLAQAFAIDADQRMLYVASADGTVRIWDLEHGTERHRIPSLGLNMSLALSQDGRFLATRSGSPEAKSCLWQVDPTGTNPPTLRYKFTGHPVELAVTALAVSPDGALVFTGDSGGTGILWDGRSGQQVGDRITAFQGYRLNGAAFNDKGDALYVVADDQQLSLFDLRSRKVTQRFSHPGFVSSLSLSADQRFAVTLNEQQTETELRTEATLWWLDSGKKQILDRSVSQLKPSKSNRSFTRLTSASFGPVGNAIAISKQLDREGAGRVTLWQANDQTQAEMKRAFMMPIHLGVPQRCAPLGTDRLLTLNGEAAFQWSYADRQDEPAQQLVSYRANAAVHSANFSWDSKYVITGSHSVKIWDAQTQKSIAKVEVPHQGPLTSVAFTPELGKYQFASCGADGTVKLWSFDAATKQVQEIQCWLDGQAVPALRRLRYSADGSKLAVVGDRGIIRVIHLNDQYRSTQYDTQEAGNLIAAVFSADGKQLIVGGDDHRARMWDIAPTDSNSNAPVLFQGHAEAIEDVAVLSRPDEPLRVMTVSRDKTARVWDARATRISSGALPSARELLVLRQHTLGLTAVDTTAATDLVVTSGRDSRVLLWEAASSLVSETTE